MTFEELNPDMKLTDGHAERESLGLPTTEVTPANLAPAPAQTFLPDPASEPEAPESDAAAPEQAAS